MFAWGEREPLLKKAVLDFRHMSAEFYECIFAQHNDLYLSLLYKISKKDNGNCSFNKCK